MKLRKIIPLILALCLVLPLAVSATEPSATLAPRIEATHTAPIPSSWDPLGERTAEAELILSLTADRLYVLSPDGQTLTPSMATELPQDVTDQYAGAFGIPENAKRGYAFSIEIRDNAAWEDGTPITAQDYLRTLDLLVERKTLTLPLANLHGFYENAQKETEQIQSLAQAGFSSVEEASDAGHSLFYVDAGHFWGLDAGWVSAEGRTRLKDSAIPSGITEMYVSGAYLFDRYLRTGAAYDVYQAEFVGVAAQPEYVTQEDVGMLGTGTHKFVLILEEPATAEALALQLKNLIIVRDNLYSGSYATSVSTYSSFGPYRITVIENGQMVLEPNPYWHGGREVFEADQIRLTS